MPLQRLERPTLQTCTIYYRTGDKVVAIAGPVA
jgi:hypothetical protein